MTSTSADDTGDLARLRLMRRAKDLMDRDWSRPIDLGAVAAEAGYSRFHFIRLFKQTYGETPGRYLSRRRVERAQDLLRGERTTVSEICVAVGFESLGSFCTRFKELTGLTPTEYRARAAGGGPAPVPDCFMLLWGGGFRVPGPGPGPGAHGRSGEPAGRPATFEKADRRTAS